MAKSGLRGLLGRREAEASRAKSAEGKRSAPPNRYQAVSIVSGGKCCAAVKALTGKRFLAGNAPSLPLPACSLSDQCKCSFQKYEDRREDNSRRLPGEMSRWYGGAEKRRSRGRRRAD